MKLLQKIYLDPKTGFVGKQKHYNYAKAIDSSITMKMVNEFFYRNEIAQTHKKIKKNSFSQHIVGPMNSIQMDLIFYPYPRQNKGYNTILTAVGINNRIGYAIPMKGKSAIEAHRAIQELINQAIQMGHPFYLVESDKESEYMKKS